MRNHADTLVEAGQRQASPIRMEEFGTPLLILGKRVVSLEKHLTRPVRARGAFRAKSPEQAYEFVNRFRIADYEVAAFWRLWRLTVYLDFHSSPELAGWCQFKVTCWCTYSQATKHFPQVHKGKFQTK